MGAFVRYLDMSDKITRREFCAKAGTLTLTLPFLGCFGPSVALGGKGVSSLNSPADTEVQMPGPPKASDVIMRSLRIHPEDSNDPHDTMRALEEFHATRLEWAYISDPAYIKTVKKSGRVFGGAVSATSYIPLDSDSAWFERVVIKDLNGKPIIAPWKRTWERSLWGCINNPELEAGYLRYLKRYIDAGVQVMQRDEAEGNYLAIQWGGCFCDFCTEGFRMYLETNSNAEELGVLGVNDITKFNYREHLRESGAPVGDAFAKWRGDDLKRYFIKFQRDATVSFHKRTRLAIKKYVGHEIPMSCNNVGVKRGPVEQVFDWWMGELRYRDATPETLYTIMHQAKKCGKRQVVTMPKKANQKDLADWVRLTRQTIAMAYACGGQCMVPWDIYMPNNAPRYFGTPDRYADLYRFVRTKKEYLDGYHEMEALIPNGEKATKESSHLSVSRSKDICIIARSNPDSVRKPVVFHLVDWSRDQKSFSLNVDFNFFNIKHSSTFNLLVPEPYSPMGDLGLWTKSKHKKDLGPIKLHVQPDNSLLIPPAINPWGLIVLEQ